VLAYNPSGPIGLANWIDNITVAKGTAILTDPNNNNAAVAVRHEGEFWKTTFWALDPLGLDMIGKEDSARTHWVINLQNPAVPVFEWFGEIPFISSINDDLSKPTKFKLSQNYPNPFNPTTTISYSLPKQSKVKLIIYDVLGRQVKTVVNKTQLAGKHKITFDATNFATGVYYYNLKADPSTGLGHKFEQTRKMLLLR